MRKRTFTRILSFLLCTLLLASVITGCSGNTSTTETTAAGTTAAAATTAAEATTAAGAAEDSEHGSLYIEGSDGVTLSYWIPIDSTAAQNYESLAEHPYFIWLEEQTGVSVEFIHPSYEQQEQQLNLMISSGNFYDILFGADYPGGPQSGIDEECFIDLNPLLDEYMPDYKAALDCSDASFAAWEWGAEKDLYDLPAQDSFRRYCTTKKGNLWCVTQIWTDSYPAECGAVIRKDWLDEAGLEVPETLEELEVVLAAFKARGEDVIPMNLDNGGTMTGDGAIISAFDLYANFWTMSDDATKVQPHAYTQDAFKDYLTLMNDWYSKGYIDPDFMNRDGDSLASLFLSDRLGIYFGQYYSSEDWEDMYTGEQAFDVVAMPLPRMTKDQQLHWCNHYMSVPTNYSSITTSCEHPEIAAQWLNVGFTKEGILRGTYGVEGDTYELRNGVPYYTDKVINGDQDYIFSCELFTSSSSYNSLRSVYMRTAENAETEASVKSQDMITWQQNADWDYVWTFVTFSDDGWGEFESAYNDACTYADPMVLKFIIGEESLDKFEEFQSTCKSIGMDRAQELAQAALDDMTE